MGLFKSLKYITKLNSKYFSLNSKVANYETISVTSPLKNIFQVELNRPQKANSMNKTMWIEIEKCFNELSDLSDCRVIVVTGAGKVFSSGIDIKELMQMAPKIAELEDVSQKCKFISKFIKQYQNCITSLENCSKPVIGAVHSACIGGGVDFITATDIRLCSTDAWFQVKEVDVGMAPDVGTLQRLPKIINSQSLVREICLTGRKVDAKEALDCGLVSKVLNDKDSLLNEAFKLAEIIAKKSPVAVQGIKKSLIYSRDHSVQEGLDHILLWNSTMLQSEDLFVALMNQSTDKDDQADFRNL